eukprot:767499-Hanusia_phi.AAC.4
MNNEDNCDGIAPIENQGFGSNIACIRGDWVNHCNLACASVEMAGGESRLWRSCAISRWRNARDCIAETIRRTKPMAENLL